MNKKIAALVILYRYDETCIENIKSYANQVGAVYAFDNTELEKKNARIEAKLREIPNLAYVDGKGNQGLSMAINKVAKRCIQKGYEWMFTFDQDSRAHANMVDKMWEFSKEYEKTYGSLNKVGIISPLIRESEIAYAKPVYPFSYVDWVIQSGAMHNLTIYEKVGGYDGKIFIHQVDTEYCFRLMNYDYRIVRTNDAVLIHNVGDEQVELKYLNGKKYYTNKFSAARYYYIVRNNLYCMKHYGTNKLFHADLWNNTKILLVTWLLEDKKAARARAMILGYFDYLFGRMGKGKWRF